MVNDTVVTLYGERWFLDLLQIRKTQQWSQDWKKSVFIPNPKKGNAKEMFKLPHKCTHFTC